MTKCHLKSERVFDKTIPTQNISVTTQRVFDIFMAGTGTCYKNRIKEIKKYKRIFLHFKYDTSTEWICLKYRN